MLYRCGAYLPLGTILLASSAMPTGDGSGQEISGDSIYSYEREIHCQPWTRVLRPDFGPLVRETFDFFHSKSHSCLRHMPRHAPRYEMTRSRSYFGAFGGQLAPSFNVHPANFFWSAASTDSQGGSAFELCFSPARLTSWINE